MINIVKGDLLKLALEGNFDIICHGCNCFNTMGAGIAKQIAEQFPIAREVDQHSTRNGDISKLGDWSVALVKQKPLEKSFYIYNLYTQYEMGKNFMLSALDIALFKFAKHLNENYEEQFKIGLPQIGAGIGGGNWADIFAVIKKHLNQFDVTIVIYES